MDETDSGLTPDLQATEARLRAERPLATSLELDRMQSRAMRATRRPRNGALLKNRLALVSMIVVGFLMSGTGATVAVTGIAGDGSSSIAQYGDEDAQGVAGEQDEGGSGGNSLGDSEGQEVAGESQGGAQGGAQEAADGDDSLPFTGFAAIPLLIGGVALMAGGTILRRRLPD